MSAKLPHMTIAEITKAVGGQFYGDNALLDEAVNGVAIDSRLITEGFLFVPIKGARVDGHSFIPQVMKQGALLCLSEEDLPDNLKAATPHIRVDSTENALRALAAWYRINLDVTVIGISGSYGKTTAKEMLASVLSEHFHVLKTEGNHNNRIGLPLTVFNIRPEHDVAILEMGISDFGEMSVLADIARPDICVITTIGDCHLEQLHDRAGVYRAKSEMFDYMNDPSGPVILRADDAILRAVREVNGHAPLFYGIGQEDDCAAYVTDIESHGLDGTDCILHLRDSSFPVHIPLPGKHLLYHMMAGALIADILGMSADEIARGAAKIRPVSGHGSIIRGKRYIIFDDCYNANPASMKAALSTLKETNRRRIAILGDMGELGESERELHRQVGVYAGENAPDLMICAGTLARAIMEGYQASPAGAIAAEEGRTLLYNSKEELLADLPCLLKEGDAVLVKASHFMGFNDIVQFINKENEV